MFDGSKVFFQKRLKFSEKSSHNHRNCDVVNQ